MVDSYGQESLLGFLQNIQLIMLFKFTMQLLGTDSMNSPKVLWFIKTINL